MTPNPIVILFLGSLSILGITAIAAIPYFEWLADFLLGPEKPMEESDTEAELERQRAFQDSQSEGGA